MMLEPVEERSCCNSQISLERFKVAVLMSCSSLISQEGDLLTLLFFFLACAVSTLLPTSASPATLDNAFLSSPME